MLKNNEKRHWTIEVTNLDGEFYTVCHDYYGTYKEAQAEVSFKMDKIEEEIGLIFKIEFIAK